MWRLFFALMILGNAQALNAQTSTPKETPPFHPAETLSVTDITIPTNVIAGGTVVLDAQISETGEIMGVEVRRDLASLTELAVSSVKDWSFSPATSEGSPIAAIMPVAVTFRPPVAYGGPITLSELKPQSEAATQTEFQPAEVVHAAFPEYPANSVVAGTVVLEVTLGAKGEVGDVKILRDLPSLTEAATAVVGRWRFMPATFNGNPVRSKIVLAFVSAPPLVITPKQKPVRR